MHFFLVWGIMLWLSILGQVYVYNTIFDSKRAYYLEHVKSEFVLCMSTRLPVMTRFIQRVAALATD